MNGMAKNAEEHVNALVGVTLDDCRRKKISGRVNPVESEGGVFR